MTENVKIYTIEELKNMGWEFLSTNTSVQTHFDDQFAELLYSENIPDDFPDVVSFKQFEPYFTGPKDVRRSVIIISTVRRCYSTWKKSLLFPASI